ncbi:MAG: hypothetical protein A4E25_01828 [Methanobacterium sp. PtaB.Bin024]|nr:MAG: hypothetical protein A4E25_01828 [Methanobacterium sp. PtaB.Bin024]
MSLLSTERPFPLAVFPLPLTVELSTMVLLELETTTPLFPLSFIVEWLIAVLSDCLTSTPFSVLSEMLLLSMVVLTVFSRVTPSWLWVMLLPVIWVFLLLSTSTPVAESVRLLSSITVLELFSTLTADPLVEFIWLSEITVLLVLLTYIPELPLVLMVNPLI